METELEKRSRTEGSFATKEVCQTLAVFFKSIGLSLNQDEEFTISRLKCLHG